VATWTTLVPLRRGFVMRGQPPGPRGKRPARQRDHHANRCAGKVRPNVRELPMSPRHPELAELKQCTIGGEQQDKLHRRQALRAGQAEEERGTSSLQKVERVQDGLMQALTPARQTTGPRGGWAALMGMRGGM